MAEAVGRDKSIDGLRGLACISVVLIHTFYYSGENLVPPYLKGMVLLIDVPLFFYVIGRSTALSKVDGWNFSGIWKLLRVYYLLLIPLWIAHCVFLGHMDFKALAMWILHDYSDSKPFVVFMGSMWFIKTYLVCIPIVQRVKSSPRAARSIWFASLFMLIMFGYPHGGLLGGTRFAFDLVTNTRPPVSSFPHSALGILSAYGALLLSGVWHFVFYGSFILFGLWHQQGELKRWTWAVTVLLSVVTLGAYRFTGAGWVGNLQNNKFPPNMIYWSYSMLSITLLVLAAKYLGAFRSFLATWLLQWMGKNALYAYFAQGFSSSLLYVYIANTGGMPLGIRMTLGFLLNLSLDMLLVWVFLWVGRQLRKVRFPRNPLGRNGSGAQPVNAKLMTSESANPKLPDLRISRLHYSKTAHQSGGPFSVSLR